LRGGKKGRGGKGNALPNIAKDKEEGEKKREENSRWCILKPKEKNVQRKPLWGWNQGGTPSARPNRKKEKKRIPRGRDRGGGRKKRARRLTLCPALERERGIELPFLGGGRKKRSVVSCFKFHIKKDVKGVNSLMPSRLEKRGGGGGGGLELSGRRRRHWPKKKGKGETGKHSL